MSGRQEELIQNGKQHFCCNIPQIKLGIPSDMTKTKTLYGIIESVTCLCEIPRETRFIINCTCNIQTVRWKDSRRKKSNTTGKIANLDGTLVTWIQSHGLNFWEKLLIIKNQTHWFPAGERFSRFDFSCVSPYQCQNEGLHETPVWWSQAPVRCLSAEITKVKMTCAIQRF